MLHLQKPLGFLLRTLQKQKRKLIKTSAHKGVFWQYFDWWQSIDCSSSTLFWMLTLLSSAGTFLKYLKSKTIWIRKYKNVRPACENFHCQVALAIYCWQINMAMHACYFELDASWLQKEIIIILFFLNFKLNKNMKHFLASQEVAY